MKMVVKKEVYEEECSGLASLLGERVLLMCANYFYEGVLDGVNDSDVLMSDVGIVYETGKWNEKAWGDRQQLPGPHFVRIQAIESYCLSPSVVLNV
jgi:hypothetical protein